MSLLPFCSNWLFPKGHYQSLIRVAGFSPTSLAPLALDRTGVLLPSYCCSQTTVPSSSLKMTSFETLNIGLYHLPLFFWQPFTDSSVTSPSFRLTVIYSSSIPITFLMILIFMYMNLSAPWPPLLQISHFHSTCPDLESYPLQNLVHRHPNIRPLLLILLCFIFIHVLFLLHPISLPPLQE